MKRISLTQGKFALVSDGDYGDLSRFKWRACRAKNTFYAMRNVRIGEKRHTELMHRRILGLKFSDGKCTDHIDMNGLNNRRNNLRIVTYTQNNQNRTRYYNNKSGFKGVYLHKQCGKWHAYIQFNGRRESLGLFEFPVDAAIAYNAAAIKYHREFAQLNKGVENG